MATPLAASVRVSTPRRLIASAIELLEGLPLSIHLLLFRLAIASVFLPAGLDKLASWEPTLALFRDEYRVPFLPFAVAAVIATTVEIGCSALLIAGLATRVATLPLLGQLLTIQLFVYPRAWPEHLVWGSILLFLLTRGAGAIALDHFLPSSLTERARPTS